MSRIDDAVVAGTRTRAELEARDDLDVAAEVAWALYRDAPTEDVNLSMRAALIGAMAVLPEGHVETVRPDDTHLHYARQVCRAFVDADVEHLRPLWASEPRIARAVASLIRSFGDEFHQPPPPPNPPTPAVRSLLSEHQLQQARRIRAWVDEAVPRLTPEGEINTKHVAIELTMRSGSDLPGFIAELDGPGKYRP